MGTAWKHAVAAVLAVVLAACGGGGGGGSSGGGAGGGGSGGPALGSGGSGGAAGSTAFAAFGPTLVATGASNSYAPRVVRLDDGRQVVAWRTDNDLRVRFVGANGAPAGDPIVVHSRTDRMGVGPAALAAAPSGGFVIAWAHDAEPANTQFHAVVVVQARRYAANGAVVWDQRVSDGPRHSVDGIDIEPTADGGFVVGWSGKQILTAPSQALLQRLAADGSRVGAQATVTGIGNPQERLALAPLPDGTVVAVWRQQEFGSRGAAYWLYTRRFSAANEPLGAAVPLSGFNGLPATQPFELDAGTLSTGNVGLAWGGTSATGREQFHVAVLAPAGTPASAVTTIEAAWPVSGVALVPLGSSGFGAPWQEFRAGSREHNAWLRMQPFDNAGNANGGAVLLSQRLTYWISPTSGVAVNAGAGFDLDGGADGHLVGTYNQSDEQPGTYVFGR